MPVLYNDGDLRTNPDTTIDLMGEKGNPLALIGIFSRIARQVGWTEEAINEFFDLQQSYNELVRKIAWHFPSVTLLTTDDNLVAFCNPDMPVDFFSEEVSDGE